MLLWNIEFVAGAVSGHCLANDLPMLLLLSLPQNLAEDRGLEPRRRFNTTDGLANRSNTIMGVFLKLTEAMRAHLHA